MIFCPSCGKQLSDEESTGKFCPYCGATIANGEPPKGNDFNDKLNEVKEGAATFVNSAVDKAQNIPGVDKVLEKVDKKYRPAAIIGAVAAAALVLILILSSLFSGGGYKAPINDYLKLVNKKTTDPMKYLKVTASDDAYELRKTLVKLSDDIEDNMKDGEDDWEDFFDDIEDEYGKKWKVSFKTKSSEKLDKDDREDIKEEYEDSYEEYYEEYIDEYEDILDDKDDLEDWADENDVSEKEAKKMLKAYIKYYKTFKKVKVSKAYEIKGTFTIKADGEKYESNTVRLTVAKINGSWVYEGADDSIQFEDADENLDLFYKIFTYFGYAEFIED